MYVCMDVYVPGPGWWCSDGGAVVVVVVRWWSDPVVYKVLLKPAPAATYTPTTRPTPATPSSLGPYCTYDYPKVCTSHPMSGGYFSLKTRVVKPMLTTLARASIESGEISLGFINKPHKCLCIPNLLLKQYAVYTHCYKVYVHLVGL